MDKDNANPTILNLSQLPTRQSRKKVLPTGPGTKYHNLIFSKPAYLGSSDEESDWDADDAGADDDFSVDPIDEQEIYGKMAPQHFCFSRNPIPGYQPCSVFRACWRLVVRHGHRGIRALASNFTTTGRRSKLTLVQI